MSIQRPGEQQSVRRSCGVGDFFIFVCLSFCLQYFRIRQITQQMLHEIDHEIDESKKKDYPAALQPVLKQCKVTHDIMKDIYTKARRDPVYVPHNHCDHLCCLHYNKHFLFFFLFLENIYVRKRRIFWRRSVPIVLNHWKHLSSTPRMYGSPMLHLFTEKSAFSFSCGFSAKKSQ